MKFLRRIFGLDFPDPAPGQVWRSRHSGKSIRIRNVGVSDDGRFWHIDIAHDDGKGGFIGIAMWYSMFQYQWRRKLRDEARELVGTRVPRPGPWPEPPGTGGGGNDKADGRGGIVKHEALKRAEAIVGRLKGIEEERERLGRDSIIEFLCELLGRRLTPQEMEDEMIPAPVVEFRRACLAALAAEEAALHEEFEAL